MRPGRGTALRQPFHLLLILAGVHRLPEAVMEIGIELALARQVRQDLRFKTIAVPVLRNILVEYEESRIDPRVAYHGLLREAVDPPGAIEVQRAILRSQRHRRHRRQAAAGVVEVEEGGKIDVAQPVSVGGEELLAHMVEAGEDAIARVSLRAGVENLDLPLGKTPIKIVEEHLLAMARGQHKTTHPLPRINLHEVHENGTPVNRHHRLREIFREGIDARALAATQNDDAKIAGRLYLVRHSAPNQRM